MNHAHRGDGTGVTRAPLRARAERGAVRQHEGALDVLVDEDRRSLNEIAGDASLSTVAGIIVFARKHFGYDWTIGALELDRSPAQFVALLNEHRASGRHRSAAA